MNNSNTRQGYFLAGQASYRFVSRHLLLGIRHAKSMGSVSLILSSWILLNQFNLTPLIFIRSVNKLFTFVIIELAYGLGI